MNVISTKIQALINFLKRIEAEWKAKTPEQKRSALYNFGRYMMASIQIGVFDDLQIGPIGYVPCIIAFIHYIAMIYTVYYYMSRGQFLQCLPTFCIYGIVNKVKLGYLHILFVKHFVPF